jgi:hypothetical protein
VRPWSTILLFAEGGAQLPFDVAPLRAIPYRLGVDGKPANPAAMMPAIAQRLIQARNADTDSPIFQLVEGFPDIQRLKTDVFRERVAFSNRMKERLAAARRKGEEAVREIETELGDVRLWSPRSDRSFPVASCRQGVAEHDRFGRPHAAPAGCDNHGAGTTRVGVEPCWPWGRCRAGSDRTN